MPTEDVPNLAEHLAPYEAVQVIRHRPKPRDKAERYYINRARLLRRNYRTCVEQGNRYSANAILARYLELRETARFFGYHLDSAAAFLKGIGKI